MELTLDGTDMLMDPPVFLLYLFPLPFIKMPGPNSMLLHLSFIFSYQRICYTLTKLILIQICCVHYNRQQSLKKINVQ